MKHSSTISELNYGLFIYGSISIFDSLLDISMGISNMANKSEIWVIVGSQFMTFLFGGQKSECESC